MDTQELYERGLALRKELFGDEAVDARMQSMGEFGVPLQHIINAYVYGDVWARDGLDLRFAQSRDARDHGRDQPPGGVPRPRAGSALERLHA